MEKYCIDCIAYECDCAVGFGWCKEREMITEDGDEACNDFEEKETY